MNSWDGIFNILLQEFEAWAKSLVKLLPNMVVAALVLFLFLFVANIVYRVISQVLERFSDNRAVNGILATGVYVLLVAVGLFVSLGILQLDKTVTSLLAGAGVIGIALGFAFQEIASNFIAGIFIAFMKPFRVGDIVEIESYLGTIKRIDIRTTSLTTFDDIEVILPNKDMFTKTLKNFTVTPKRRLDIKVGVSYSTDLRMIRDVVKKCLDSLPYRVKEEEILVEFVEFGDSSINFVTYIWVHYPGNRNFSKTLDEAIIRIKEAFDTEGIVIPFPMRTLELGAKEEEFMKSISKSIIKT